MDREWLDHLTDESGHFVLDRVRHETARCAAAAELSSPCDRLSMAQEGTYIPGEVSVMVDDRSLSPSPALHSDRSAWRFVVPVVWVGLGLRLIVALVRNESIRDDFLSLALVAFFMTTAVLGSRIWLWLQDRWARLAVRRAHAPPREA